MNNTDTNSPAIPDEKIIAALVRQIGGIEMPVVGAAYDALEVELLKYEQEGCPVYHHFSPGLYIREVKLPAGTVALGHRQKTEHLNIFLEGRITIVSEDGSVSEIKAPMLFTGKPGRKCGYVHEDVVWLNIYPTNETDIEILEATYLDKSDSWKHESLKVEARVKDRDDYEKVLSEWGYTEKTVRAQTENPHDQIPFPPGSYPIGIFPSAIEGRGVFATANIKAGDLIAPSRIGVYRTPAGRYTNHSQAPNAMMEKIGDTMFLVATSDISGCHGGMVGEEITVNYRDVLTLKFSEVSSCRQ